MNIPEQLCAVGWQVLGTALCGAGQILQVTADVVHSGGEMLEHWGQCLKAPAPAQE